MVIASGSGWWKARRLLFLLCLCPVLIAFATGYVLTIDAPRTLTAGEPLVVNGTSTLPVGYTHDLVLYSGPAERARITIVVQQGGTFSVRFDMTGLTTGDYRIELVPPRDPSFFGSSSVTSLFVTVTDRSKEVVVTSPAAQSDVRNLTVAGTAPGKQSGSIAIAVTGPGNYTLGPEYVRTDASGAFSKSAPIQGPGDYRVVLSDVDGQIARFTFTVGLATQPSTTPTTSVTTEVTTMSKGTNTPAPVASISDTVGDRGGTLVDALGFSVLLLLCILIFVSSRS